MLTAPLGVVSSRCTFRKWLYTFLMYLGDVFACNAYMCFSVRMFWVDWPTVLGFALLICISSPAPFHLRCFPHSALRDRMVLSGLFLHPRPGWVPIYPFTISCHPHRPVEVVSSSMPSLHSSVNLTTRVDVAEYEADVLQTGNTLFALICLFQTACYPNIAGDARWATVTS